MIGIWANLGAIIGGTLIGWGFQHVLAEKYLEALWVALGLAALGIGASTVVTNLPKSHYPLLFVISLAIGLPLGSWLNLDERSSNWINHRFKSQLGEALATATFLDCIGALAILGPVQAATNGDQTMLYTNAMFVLVSAIIFGARFGFGMLLQLPIVFAWLFTIYLTAHEFSTTFFSTDLVVELSIVGGLLIIAAALSVLKIRDFKSLNMLPALFIPLLFFLGRLWF